MRLLVFFGVLVLARSCAVNGLYTVSNSNSVHRRYAPAELRKHYAMFETIPTTEHPGLYWYTPADSVENYCKAGKAQIKDSMTEVQFRYLLSSITSKIRCGHTTVRASRDYFSGRDSLRTHQFPLN